MKLSSLGTAFLALVAAGLVACGDDGVQADPTVSAFVGTWEADSLVMISQADTSMHDNIIGQGGSFTIVVEPSGQYTATLGTTFGTAVEIGDIDVLSMSALQLNRTYPSMDIALLSYSFDGDDRLILDGDTEYDFNRDRTPEPARGYIELQLQ